MKKFVNIKKTAFILLSFVFISNSINASTVSLSKEKKENLMVRVSENQEFFKTYIVIQTIYRISGLKYFSTSPKQNKIDEVRKNELLNLNRDLNKLENDELSMLIGFNDETTLSMLNNKYELHKKNFYNAIPELKDINDSDATEIFDGAIQKGNIVEKGNKFFSDKVTCLANAEEEFQRCSTRYYNEYYGYVGAGVVCVVGFLGAGTIAAGYGTNTGIISNIARFWTASMGTCVAWFSQTIGQSTTYDSTCSSSNQNNVTHCVAMYHDEL